MKKLQDELTSVAKTLTNLSKQVSRISKQVEKINNANSGPTKNSASNNALSANGDTLLGSVYEVVRRSRNGASISKLREKTQLEARQLSNALYKLSKRGKITTVSRGVYIKSPK